MGSAKKDKPFPYWLNIHLQSAYDNNFALKYVTKKYDQFASVILDFFVSLYDSLSFGFPIWSFQFLRYQWMYSLKLGPRDAALG